MQCWWMIRVYPDKLDGFCGKNLGCLSLVVRSIWANYGDQTAGWPHQKVVAASQNSLHSLGFVFQVICYFLPWDSSSLNSLKTTIWVRTFFGSLFPCASRPGSRKSKLQGFFVVFIPSFPKGSEATKSIHEKMIVQTLPPKNKKNVFLEEKLVVSIFHTDL